MVFYSILKISILILIKATLREMFDFLDANKSGELYTAEAVDGLRELAINLKLKISELEEDAEKKRKIV